MEAETVVKRCTKKIIKEVAFFYFSVKINIVNKQFFLVTFSALIFNLAFFFPYHLGWLALFFSLPLLFVNERRFSQGFLWGLLVFGPNFYWVLHVLITRATSSSASLSLSLYLSVVIYFSLTSALLFSLLRKSERFLLFIPYFYFLEKFSLSFFDVTYPFLSPLLPLCSSKLFLLLMSFFTLKLPQGGELSEIHGIPLHYIKPDVEQYSLPTVTQRIYQKLSEIKEEERENLIFAPESTFPFPLNKHPEAIAMWRSSLPPQSHFFIGALREEGKKLYQTVFWIHQGRIVQYYDKIKPAPFTEHVPKLFKSFPIFKNLFLQDCSHICKGRTPVTFRIRDDLILNPLICSDILSDKEVAPGAITCWFSDETWFPAYFQRLMACYANFLALRTNSPVIFVKFLATA